jgi:hypothetical protein
LRKKSNLKGPSSQIWSAGEWYHRISLGQDSGTIG